MTTFTKRDNAKEKSRNGPTLMAPEYIGHSVSAVCCVSVCVCVNVRVRACSSGWGAVGLSRIEGTHTSDWQQAAARII